MAYTTIKKPSSYFNTITYTGNSTSTAYTVGFPTDFVWIKKRDTEATDHYLFNKISGVEKTLYSNLTNAEETNVGSVTSFDGNGFTSGSSGGTNQNGHGYVSWNWLANGGVPVINTVGSISSTVSANTTSGFSIVSWTGNGSAGATVGHGLGSTPKMIIVKRRNTAAQWNVYHESLGNTGALYLNDSIAFNVVAGFWNNTSPNSTTFTLGTDAAGNGSGDTYIAYCFAEKQGFSKFGSYTGNGNADGTFIYTGFKPAWLLIKETTQIRNWVLYDNKRVGYNPNQYEFLPDTSNTEDTTTTKVDLLSNGFKIKASHTTVNENAQTYIYMAFAEQPLVGDNPATAR